jgi:hypothetical protein
MGHPQDARPGHPPLACLSAPSLLGGWEPTLLSNQARRVYHGAVFEIKKEIRVYGFKASGILGLSR